MAQNQGKIFEIKARANSIKADINKLTMQLEECKEDHVLKNLTETVSFLQSQVNKLNLGHLKQMQSMDGQNSSGRLQSGLLNQIKQVEKKESAAAPSSKDNKDGH